MCSNRIAVKLFNDYGAKLPITIGLYGVAILSLGVLLIQSPAMQVFSCVLFFLRGIFSGLCGAPIQTLNVMGFTKAEISQANSIFNISRQIAISLGVAVSSIFISIGLKLNGITGNLIVNYPQALKVFSLGFLAITIAALLGVYIAQRISRPTEV